MVQLFPLCLVASKLSILCRSAINREPITTVFREWLSSLPGCCSAGTTGTGLLRTCLNKRSAACRCSCSVTLTTWVRRGCYSLSSRTSCPPQDSRLAQQLLVHTTTSTVACAVLPGAVRACAQRQSVLLPPASPIGFSSSWMPGSSQCQWQCCTAVLVASRRDRTSETRD